MSTANQATLNNLEFLLKRAQGRFELHKTAMLQERIERLEDAIQFIKKGN